MSNVLTRIIVSVLAIPVIVLLTYLGNWYFVTFILFISLLAFYEFSKLSKSKGVKLNFLWGVIGITFIILNKFLQFHSNYFDIIIFWFLVLLLIELFSNKESAMLNLALSTLGFLFFSISGYSLVGISEIANISTKSNLNGSLIVISVLSTIWVSDSAAYFIGIKFGKHKLYQKVSPNKSWEGAIAGFISAILFMILLHLLILDFIKIVDTIVIAIIIGTFGQIGDLFESLLKRDAATKDSSNLIPGHGGIFDRFDSLFFSVPFIYYYIIYFL